MADTKPPKVFISYAWEDDLKTWVLDFATRLRSDGINAILDQWETVPGDQLTQFMEKSVRESDFVVLVCTPTYKRKSDRRRGGVGYEGSIITGEVFSKNNHRKFIPVLRKGKWASAAPSWATSKLFIDFRDIPYSEASYQQLLNTLFGKSPTAPPILDDTLREIAKREAAEKVAREKAERDASEKAERESVEQEAAEKVAREKAEHEVAEKVAREKAELEAAEKAEREKVEQEAAEKVAREKTARESSEKPERERIAKERLEKAEHEASEKAEHEKAAREKLEREAAEKAKREKTERETAERLAREKAVKEYHIKSEKMIKDARRRLKWQNFLSKIRYWFAITRSYSIQIFLILIAISLLVFANNFLPANFFSPRQTATTDTLLVTRQNLSSTEVFVSTETFAPNSTATDSLSSTATSLPTEITDAKDVSMVLVPTGIFIMGTSREDYTYYLDVDQNPAHNVFLDAFYIDKYEVTNFLYKTCEDAGVCTRPYNKSSNNRPQYYGNSEFDNYPVIYVDWYQAKAYCEWRGARFPSEAEWEKAARGTDGRYYSWADNTNGAANLTDVSLFTGDTTEVGNYPSGKSPYGAYDMIGNVWEWVDDWYKSDYYTTLGDNAVNPQGLSEGDSKVLRGGAWTPDWPAGGGYVEVSISTFNRHRDYPSRFHYDVGFRCAKDAP